MRPLRTTLALALATTAGSLAVAAPAHADHGGLTVTGLTANDRLVTFKASAPGTILSTVKVTGLEAGDDLAALDFRPATGGLYGVSSSDAGAHLYLINPVTGAATRVGTATYPIAGDLSMDFNPAVDRLRLVSTDGTNLRVNPNDGALVATDGRLAYAATDPAAGSTPAVAAVAYLNNDNDPATGTTLYDIDAATDTLVSQVPPNSGTLNTIGATPATNPAKTGLDIYTRLIGATAGTNWAFASVFDKGVTTFYELDLTTGGPRTSGAVPGSGKAIGSTPAVVDIAVATGQPGF